MDEATAQRYASTVAEALQRGHNVMLVGERGSGKTMIARRVVDYFSPLNVQESKQLDDIYSHSGMAAPGHGAIASRPFRAPHHSVSEAAMVGTRQRPGEISLALYGVLFMDEFLSFSADVVNATRRALKVGHTQVGWNADPVYLIGTMHPDEQEPSWLPQMFSTVINLDEPVVSQSAARTAQQDPRKPKTERERMADFFFGKPGSLKRRGLAEADFQESEFTYPDGTEYHLVIYTDEGSSVGHFQLQETLPDGTKQTLTGSEPGGIEAARAAAQRLVMRRRTREMSSHFFDSLPSWRRRR